MEKKLEDFFFSEEQLRQHALSARGKEKTICRCFINDTEFTERMASGGKSNYEDAIVVGLNIDPMEQHFAYQDVDPYTVLHELGEYSDEAENEDSIPWTGWDSQQIARIEDCAKKNGVLEIDLPKEEWDRLKAEEMASLKSLLSENASCRLVLLEDAPKRYYLLIAHLGSCMH
ncbi:MAG: hypothetical protein WC099_02255 [Candidatus Paceibacterota bacterium]